MSNNNILFGMLQMFLSTVSIHFLNLTQQIRPVIWNFYQFPWRTYALWLNRMIAVCAFLCFESRTVFIHKSVLTLVVSCASMEYTARLLFGGCTTAMLIFNLFLFIFDHFFGIADDGRDISSSFRDKLSSPRYGSNTCRVCCSRWFVPKFLPSAINYWRN